MQSLAPIFQAWNASQGAPTGRASLTGGLATGSESNLLPASGTTTAGSTIPPVVQNIGGQPFGSSAILPGVLPFQNPDLQSQWVQFLTQMMGKGSAPYNGQLSPDPNSTILPKVNSSWQPWDSGMGYIANAISGGLGIGKTDPNLQNMMSWGGTGGPGNQAMSNMMQFGTPSAAGQYMANLAQSGGSSPEIASLLSNQAQGFLTGGAQYLAPFLQGGNGRGPYQAPAIPSRQISIARN